MMRVLPLLRAGSWRDAVRELLLIVAGVLVALWVNDWNQARLDHARERTALYQLLATTRENERRTRLALAQDSVALDAIRRLAAAQPAGAAAGAPVPPHPDSVVAWRGRAFKFAAFSPLTGTYAALAGSGELNLLRNDSLRAQVATFSGELSGDVQEMNGWFDSFSRNVDYIMRTAPLQELRPLYRGRPSSAPVSPQTEALERALIQQYVVLGARSDVLRRLLAGTTALHQALEAELQTSR